MKLDVFALRDAVLLPAFWGGVQLVATLVTSTGMDSTQVGLLIGMRVLVFVWAALELASGYKWVTANKSGQIDPRTARRSERTGLLRLWAGGAVIVAGIAWSVLPASVGPILVTMAGIYVVLVVLSVILLVLP